MQLSILICTYNRASVLKATLSSLKGQLVGLLENVEVIVVDNASTDKTVEVVQSFEAIQYCREKQLGLSNARNRALREARGEWVIFLDDDVIPRVGWLDAYLRFIRTAPEDCGFFGGRIVPDFEEIPPKAFLDEIQYMHGVWGLCEIDHTNLVIQSVENDLPVGANFGGRREAFVAVGFDPKYGRQGTKLQSFEETLLMEALLKNGWLGYWVKGAEIAHRVSVARFNLEYVARFYEGLGRSHWAHRQEPGKAKLLWKVLKGTLRGSRSKALEDLNFTLRDFTRQHYYFGAFKEAFGLS